jgi:hypothetical protein
MSLLLVPHLFPIAGIQHTADLKKLVSVTPGCYDVLHHFEKSLDLSKHANQREGELEGAERVWWIDGEEQIWFEEGILRLLMPSFAALREEAIDASLSDEP